MRLDEYRAEIEKGERGEFEDAPDNAGATRAMFGTMAAQIRGAAWHPWARPEALGLAGRAERLARDPESPYPEIGETEPETAADFRALRERLGSRRDVAKLIETPYRTLEDWEAGRRRVPGVAWVALRLLLGQQTKPE